MGEPQPSPVGSRLLLVAQRQVVRENVSEASVDAQTLAGELSAWYDLALHAYDDPAAVDWAGLREQAQREGRRLILATTSRHRQPALKDASPDLHLAFYNPYAVQDVAAPAVVSFGFRPLARAAVWAWLRGEGL